MLKRATGQQMILYDYLLRMLNAKSAKSAKYTEQVLSRMSKPTFANPNHSRVQLLPWSNGRGVRKINKCILLSRFLRFFFRIFCTYLCWLVHSLFILAVIHNHSFRQHRDLPKKHCENFFEPISNMHVQIMLPWLYLLLPVLIILNTTTAWQISNIKTRLLKINDLQTRHHYRLGDDDAQHQEKTNAIKNTVVNLSTLKNSTSKQKKKPYTYLDARKEIKRMYALRHARRKLMLLTGKTFASKNPTAYFIKIVNPLETNTTRAPAAIVTNVEELRSAVLDRNIELKDITFRNVSFVGSAVPKNNAREQVMEKVDSDCSPFDHEVMKLIAKRVKDSSKPGSRARDDTAHLALSIEGGGMR